MKKVFSLVFIVTAVLAMTLSVCAKETVVYENDFSSALTDLSVRGDWQIVSGKLTTGTGSGSAFLTYTIPTEYAGCDYQVDVDFIGHTSTGGILIGATADGLTAPANFYGFDCFTGSAGDKGAVGSYNKSGSWGGVISQSDSVMSAGEDIHLTVRVVGNKFTYRVTNIDGTDDYYGIEYTIGQNEKYDIYSALTQTVGLRKFYSDNGYFDNFKVTVFEDDVLPAMSKKAKLGDTEFAYSGLAVSGGKASGEGAMLTTSAMEANFKASMMLSPENVSKLFFGMTDEKNGYAFDINKKDETVGFYKITDGEYTTLGLRRIPVGDGPFLTYISVHDGIATAFFDAYSNGESTFPMFEFDVEGYTAGKFGIWLEGGEVTDFNVGESTGKIGETFENPIFDGADPEIIYYDGTYYAYRRVSAGTGVVRAYTSPDLVNWVERGIVYTHLDNYTGSSYMSPNVLYNEPDGLFYLFLAGKNAEKTRSCIYYAYSESPLGPFIHLGGEQTTLHDDTVSEIGGAPYVDEDGKLYLTYARFGNGNHIYIEQFEARNGVVSPVGGTLRKVVSPSEYYEIDGYGNISEGGILTKHNGMYYMILASGHYLGNYGASYAVAEDILGPYTKYEYNEIMTHNAFVDGVGDCIFVRSPDQSELWVAYHQHKEIGTVELRRTRIDKVQFVKDPNGGPDIMTINGPSTTPQIVPSHAYKYDLNRDGNISLIDVLRVAKATAEQATTGYKGTFDIDANGRVNSTDVRRMIEKVIE